jgi:hypothetical protein
VQVHARCSSGGAQREASPPAPARAAARATLHASPASRGFMSVTPRVSSGHVRPPVSVPTRSAQPRQESAPRASTLQDTSVLRRGGSDLAQAGQSALQRSRRAGELQLPQRQQSNVTPQQRAELGHGPFACAEPGSRSRLAQVVQRLQADSASHKDAQSLRAQSTSRVAESSRMTRDSDKSAWHMRR